jgi:cation:H+ antiporter
LIASLAGLILAADFFIRSSEKIGLALGIPHFVMGVTVVALGTSLPELVSSLIAVSDDASEIVLGNVVGSNISNICLILGIIGIMGGKIRMAFDIMQVELPLLMGSAFFLGLSIWDGNFTLFEAFICLAGLGIYLAYILKMDREELPEKGMGPIPLRPRIGFKDPLILLGSAIVIYFSADYLVESIIRISTYLNVGTELLALTVVSLGTSLPELVVSVVAVRKKNADMAIGNVIGSNIFNVFAVMGIPRLFGGIVVPESILKFSLPLMLVATFLCFFILEEKMINRWSGWLLVLFYIFFIGNLLSYA